MNTLLNLVIIITCMELIRNHLAQIKYNPLLPEVELFHLHLKIYLYAIFHLHMHIQNSVLVIFVLFPQNRWQKRCLFNLFRTHSQKCSYNSFAHLRILHQFLETKIYRRQHNKFLVGTISPLHCSLSCFSLRFFRYSFCHMFSSPAIPYVRRECFYIHFSIYQKYIPIKITNQRNVFCAAPDSLFQTHHLIVNRSSLWNTVRYFWISENE